MSEKLLKLADKMAADIWLDENDGHGKYCYFCREFMSDGHAYDCPAWLYLEERRKPAEAAPEPEQSDRERARKLGLLIVLGMMDGLGKRGETLADDAKQKVLEATDQYISAEFAEVRAEATAAERERCAKVCEGMSQAFTPCADAIRGLK